jgi:hypothetical protein
MTELLMHIGSIFVVMGIISNLFNQLRIYSIKNISSIYVEKEDSQEN